MLISNFDGTYTGGIHDVVCILEDSKTGRYHASFFEGSEVFQEKEEEHFVVMLKSKMHHTIGTETIEEALLHLENLKQTIKVPNENVWLEPKKWDGGEGVVWLISKW